MASSDFIQRWLRNISSDDDNVVELNKAQNDTATTTSTCTYTSATTTSFWTPDDLETCLTAVSFSTGTGASLFSLFRSDLEAAENEIIIVTCFWARSESLDTLCDVLHNLSKKATERASSSSSSLSTAEGGGRVRNGLNKKIKVRICFSSSSIFQKLFHTSSPKGYVYPPSTWSSKLGLPRPEELPGLDLTVKSIFFRPFSVMHSKFIIIDRQVVLVPSCNVSWETWFEGCLKLSGDIVSRFYDFWLSFWADYEEKSAGGMILSHEDGQLTPSTADTATATATALAHRYWANVDAWAVTNFSNGRVDDFQPSIPSVFLPSNHHVNPKFRPTSLFLSFAPQTPLNNFLIHSLSQAKRDIYIQSPNVTAPPVLRALLECVERGVDVKIVTNDRLMVLEQLVTAGTTTSRCMKWLIKNYENAKRARRRSFLGDRGESGLSDYLGALDVLYWGSTETGTGTGTAPPILSEAQRSHLKLTIVDMELVVLGSGNMDRASWYTSQELGVSFLSDGLARDIWTQGIAPFVPRMCRRIFDSSADV